MVLGIIARLVYLVFGFVFDGPVPMMVVSVATKPGVVFSRTRSMVSTLRSSGVQK